MVKAFGAESRETERLAVIASRLRNSRIQALLLKGTFDAVLDAIPALANVAMVMFGAYRIRSGFFASVASAYALRYHTSAESR